MIVSKPLGEGTKAPDHTSRAPLNYVNVKNVTPAKQYRTRLTQQTAQTVDACSVSIITLAVITGTKM